MCAFVCKKHILNKHEKILWENWLINKSYGKIMNHPIPCSYLFIGSTWLNHPYSMKQQKMSSPSWLNHNAYPSVPIQYRQGGVVFTAQWRFKIVVTTSQALECLRSLVSPLVQSLAKTVSKLSIKKKTCIWPNYWINIHDIPSKELHNPPTEKEHHRLKSAKR